MSRSINSTVCFATQIFIEYRIRTNPPTYHRLIIPCAKVIQPRLGIKLFPGKLVPRDTRRRLSFIDPRLSEREVLQVLVHRAACIGDHVAAAEMVTMVEVLVLLLRRQKTGSSACRQTVDDSRLVPKAL